MPPLNLESIHNALVAALRPSRLELRDDSEKHRGHAGHREGMLTHIHVTIAAQQFHGLSRVAQHRLVYSALAPFTAAGLHAVAMEIQNI